MICTELYHYGVKGMKWGIRRYQNKDGSLTAQGRVRYAEESDKSVLIKSDGSKRIPKGFIFNRVGGPNLDVNAAGALYVSYGKEDAARYVKSLGPTPLGKLLNTASYNVQHLTVKEPLNIPSDDMLVAQTAKIVKRNPSLRKAYSESIYSMVYDADLDGIIADCDLDAAIKRPKEKQSVKLAYGVSSLLGDPSYATEAKVVYDHFRKLGYDAIPDLHDTLSGTSSTAMVIVNPEKLQVTSSTYITKDVMRDAKKLCKKLGNLKVSVLISD